MDKKVFKIRMNHINWCYDMHPAAKLVIGILIFLAGLYWYLPQNSLNALMPEFIECIDAS